ncbi:hypothetical protein [Leisingera sp. S232]|uniref:hypothetical protein n=1 Tax=Leisingera sp. S232 TaxID=3415132 RepID=UPI0008693B88|nr:hypothetical protein AB838_01455 [Rhodobacteraceae bacterium (ex Bugula neritina AB1)]
MLKLKEDAQSAVEPDKARGTAVRIDGVSAPKTMKIGLVTSGTAPGAEQTSAADKVKPAKAVNSAEPATRKPEPAPDAKQRDQVQDGDGSALPKLALAAAGLAVAAAMLLYFQFGGTTVPDAQSVAGQSNPAAEAQLAGAAAAAGADGMVASSEDALVARITEGTLAALRSKQVQPAASVQTTPAAPAETSALYKMVLTAAAQGQSEAYIDQLVNGAYERQEITVPASLIGDDGRVDTATLLALFVGN